MKRPLHNGDSEPVSKRRRRISASDDDEFAKAPGTPVYAETPPLHKIYNSSCRKERPDELFRKDLISAMKLPDSEQLEDSEFWAVSDSWKQEWERGVQVPVNSKNVPNANTRFIREKSKSILFKLPKKFMRTTKDTFFSDELHILTDTATKAESVCKYDMDDIDSEWLKLFNENREDLGLPYLNEDAMERILEDFESQCSKRFQDALKTEKGLGIEYDEDVICDVCRSPDCEEGNEMVFCDACNICVHQACYGITAIPEGSWVCRPCAANVKPSCVLCPNLGGAMKCTSGGGKWAHVSCALWIPEVNIGCPEKMEPVTKISQIPASRWALICSVCRERVGACIQCSVKTCKIAYHVTCGFEEGLEMEMKTTPLDSKEEGVKMQSLCAKHSKGEHCSDKSPPLTPKKAPKKTRKKKEVQTKDSEPNEVDEHNARLQKIKSLEAQFHKFVSVKDTANFNNMDIHVVDFLYCYWVLKRRAKFNKPLLITKGDEANLLMKQHENLLYSQMKMFVHLRQDLERVRNLCYMIGRREKIFRSFMRTKSQLFEKQNEILTEHIHNLTSKDTEDVLKASVGKELFERIYAFIPIEPSEDLSSKTSPQKQPNPYAKSYANSTNTRSRRRTMSQNLLENGVDLCDSESNEMPVLTKCKSEENLASQDPSVPPLTNCPLVIKLESKKSKESKTSPVLEAEFPTHASQCNRTNKIASDLEVKSADIDERETLRTNSENTFTKKKHVISDATSDKNLMSLSDKENIIAHTPIKPKKTRSQLDLQFADLSSQKPDVFDDESISDDIDSSSVKKHFKSDKRKTRYQMRSCGGSDYLDVDSQTLNFDSQVCSSSESNADCVSKTLVVECVNENNSQINCPETPKRKRGRPRKIPLTPNSVQSDCPTEIQTTPPLMAEEPETKPEDFADFEDCSGFRMSLRHVRDQQSPKSEKWKRSIIIKMNHPDSPPFKDPSNSLAIENGTIASSPPSPDWSREDNQPPSHVEQSPSRIVIRLRKDPNRESWKNDSISSSDVPVAFRIVRDDSDPNSTSEPPPLVNGDESPQNLTSAIREDAENRHRYPMRDRSVLPRSLKLTLGKS